MAETPTISIAMATYNGARFLRQQLESLAAQDCLPTELVISDDASSDDTAAIVEAFARDAPFAVRWLGSNETRLGAKGNFMRAAVQCRSELISFCDQDDVWYPRKLASAVEALRDPGIILFTHAARLIDAEGAPLGFLRKPIEPASITPAQRTPPWLFWHGFVMTFRRRLLDFAPFWDRPWDPADPAKRDDHDTWFGLLSAVLGNQAYCSEPLADYRQHGRNVYGYKDEAQTFFRRLRSQLEDRHAVYADLSDECGRRARILDAIAAWSETTPTEAASASKGARSYRTLAALYETRAKLYTAGAAARVRAMASLIGSHAYDGAGEWTFGGKALLKDAALGLAFAPLTARYGVKGADGDPTCRSGLHRVPNGRPALQTTT